MPRRQSVPRDIAGHLAGQERHQAQGAVLRRRVEPGQGESHGQDDRQQPEPQADVAELVSSDRGHRRTLSRRS